MAPDINSMPPSTRQERSHAPQPSDATSRRASQQMPPPPAPAPPLQRSPVMTIHEGPALPIRHPRPLTAAELYLECEKEQEAVVNRLTRELTALRAQSASVASNASHSSTSTSASLLPVDISDPNPAHQLTGATHPTPSRRHRSSSSLSSRSVAHTPATSAPPNASGSVQMQVGGPSAALTYGMSQASSDRAAAARGADSRSRQPSLSASGRSTPARQSLDSVRPTGLSYTLPHRPSLSRDPSLVSQTTTASSTAAHAGTPIPQSPMQSISAPYYTDTAAYRSEMEIVKAENEALRQRVRALERALQTQRRDSSTSDVARPSTRDRDNSAVLPSSGVVSSESRAIMSPTGVAAWAANNGGVGGVAPPRERSESQSTTASSRRAFAAEDDVRLGESASNAGTGRMGY